MGLQFGNMGLQFGDSQYDGAYGGSGSLGGPAAATDASHYGTAVERQSSLQQLGEQQQQRQGTPHAAGTSAPAAAPSALEAFAAGLSSYQAQGLNAGYGSAYAVQQQSQAPAASKPAPAPGAQNRLQVRTQRPHARQLAAHALKVPPAT